MHQAAARSTKFCSSAQADVAALLGVELRRPHRPLLDRRPRTGGRTRTTRRRRSSSVGLGRERVHEVAPRRVGQTGAAAASPAARRSVFHPICGSRTVLGQARDPAGARCRGRRRRATRRCRRRASACRRRCRGTAGRRSRPPWSPLRARCRAAPACTRRSCRRRAARRRRADAISPASVVSRASAPRCCSAFSADRRFPIP